MLEITIYEMSRNDRNGNQYHGLVCNDGRKSGVTYKTSSEQLLRDFLGYDRIESLFDVQIKYNCVIRVYSNLGYRDLCKMCK